MHIELFRVSDELIQIIAQGSLFANTLVRFFGVVPQKVFHEGLVEIIRLVQCTSMIIGKLLLDSPVEPLKVPT